MNEDADQSGRTDEILRSLLEDDDDSDLLKELSGFPQEELDAQLAKLLPVAIKNKEAYLKRACKRTTQHTNPQGETFVFGKFGPVVATLLYLNPQEGWQLAESLEDEDFKDLDPEPKKYLRMGYLTTHQDEDRLIETFLDQLEHVNPQQAKTWRESWQEGSVDSAYLAYEVLPDKLNNYCLPFTYFGQYESDSDWGVWANREQIEEVLAEKPDELQATHQGEPVPTGSKYVVVMNQHDYPVALLDGVTGKEIWHVNY